MFNSIQCCQITFQNGSNSLHLHQPCLRTPISLQLCQYFIIQVSFFFFPISSAPFFKIGIQLIYNIVLVSAVQQHESALISSKYSHIPSLLILPPTSPSHSTPKVIKEHWAELPVLNSSFPLASYFTHDSVYMSMAPSRFSLPSPSPSCPRSFSTPMSLLLPCK